jgi:hypothetical protein
MRKWSGGCLCGAVRINIKGDVYRVGICHCLDCRKHHGAVFHTFAVFPVDAVSIEGRPASFGNRHFCAQCGSSLFSVSGDEIELMSGASMHRTWCAPRTRTGSFAAKTGCRRLT